MTDKPINNVRGPGSVFVFDGQTILSATLRKPVRLPQKRFEGAFSKPGKKFASLNAVWILASRLVFLRRPNDAYFNPMMKPTKLGRGPKDQSHPKIVIPPPI